MSRAHEFGKSGPDNRNLGKWVNDEYGTENNDCGKVRAQVMETWCGVQPIIMHHVT